MSNIAYMSGPGCSRAARAHWTTSPPPGPGSPSLTSTSTSGGRRRSGQLRTGPGTSGDEQQSFQKSFLTVFAHFLFGFANFINFM